MPAHHFRTLFCLITAVGLRLHVRLDQGTAVDLALHSERAPSFFLRHTVPALWVFPRLFSAFSALPYPAGYYHIG
jgi:hypothetical protein